ncbi:MAG: GMC family oxidoreductase, partial [Bacteroidetes bacterium]|nr:GMC family oxidoreductase [Bacteroidota bacterium]
MSKFYFNDEQESYDAIVVGTGISGGMAAKELCENGLKTLILERGPMKKHREDYPTANLDQWDMPNGGELTVEEQKRQEKQSRTGYTTNKASAHWFVDDVDHPYNETERFDWMRGYHVGGRSVMWGRHSYRWSDINFEANAREGIAVDWPVRYKDIAPWYSKVEQFIGVSGEALGLSQLPDSEFEPPMPFNCAEQEIREKVAEHFDGRVITPGRVAHITSDKQFDGDGRIRCQYRNRCIRGCPFGSYFSSLSSTLPVAERTGNLTLRPDSIVTEVIYDADTQKATGVRVIDRVTKEEYVFKAKVVFLCASAIASTSILMQSRSDRFPNGLGNDSGQLGRNIMDHHFLVGARGIIEGHEDKYYKGRKVAGWYVPAFRNIGGSSNRTDFKRSYGYQGGAGRGSYDEFVAEAKFGPKLKDAILAPGQWNADFLGFGEILPYEDNRFTLDYDRLDQWGLPTPTFNATIRENEIAMRKDMQEQAVAMLEKSGAKNIEAYDRPYALGLGIHEMGTARMGRDPKT